MNQFITTHSTGRNVGILFGLMVVCNVLLGMSLGGNPNLSPLDLQFSYSPEKAYELLAAYNESERHIYQTVELSVDLIYPISYAFFFSFVVFRLLGKVQLAKLPLMVGLMDILENVGIVFLLANYPEKMNELVQVTSVFTTLKWSLLVVVLLLVLVGLLRKAIAFFRKK